MNKLSKEKKLHLAIVGIATLVIMAGLWFGLISMQQAKIQDIARKGKNVQQQIDKMQRVIVETAQVSEELKAATNHLATIETTMPAGDLFSWTVSSIKQFNTPAYKVDMPQIGAPTVSDVREFPGFPYNQAAVIVSGSAYYYDFGKFVADLENHFPYLRVQNLNLEPGPGTTAEEHEKLSFRMEIINLVKPTRPTS